MLNNNSNQRLPPPESQNVDDWCYRQTKNKPQFNSIAGPICFMYISGSHIAWGNATPAIKNQEWYVNVPPNEQLIVFISWYIGAIIGSVILFFVNEKLTRKTLYIACGLMFSLSSALMIIFPQHSLALLGLRLIAGIAHGLVFIAAIFHGAENSLNKMRPQIVTLMPLSLLVGYMLTPILVSISYEDQDPNYASIDENKLLGIVNLIFSISAIGLTPFFTYESVVVSASRGEDETALTNMARLRREPIENAQIQYDYQEIKAMLEEDRDQNISPLQEGNGRAIITLLLSRLLLVLSMNYAINMIKVDALTPLMTIYMAPSMGFIVRCLFVSIICLFVNPLGRKNLLVVSAAASGACLIVMVILSLIMDESSDGDIIGIFSLIFDAAIGVGVAFVPDIIMAEAFPAKKKLASAMVAFILENALQIILMGILYDINKSDFEVPVLAVSAGLFAIVTGALIYWTPKMPSNTTLRAARAVFRSDKSGLNGHF